MKISSRASHFHLLTLICLTSNIFAQKVPAWDNTAQSTWGPGFELVAIPSSADGSIQSAYLHRSKSKTTQPLIVSLHTWSGDYSQEDPLVKEILARDWNYIHPDFRGRNNTPDAMGSPLVVGDIEDAIRFALKETNADADDVHIIGVSGGGYATLLCFMKMSLPIRTFSAWAPISDIEAWYWESLGRRQKYAKDILMALGGDSTLNNGEARRRSPLHQAFPQHPRRDSRLFIYEGVHDGYTGSVPITHSINMYNRLVGELRYGTSDLAKIAVKASSDPVLVSNAEIINLLTRRSNPDRGEHKSLFGRDIHLFREYENIQLTIFEGGHEQLPQALSLIPHQQTSSLKANILTIGDSNGESTVGWVEQLKLMLPNVTMINNSRSGRTIGFDNLGSKELNALTQIDTYLAAAEKQTPSGKYDYIILCLGTNDTKKEFADRQNEVVANFDKLLSRIERHKIARRSKLIFVTPPPMGTRNMEEKYVGGNERLSGLVPQLMKIASRHGFQVIDVYHPLLRVFDAYTPDGVHMVAEGQKIIASKIVDHLPVYPR